ncbi:MAG: hypothetical protein LBM78_03780, partial [Clostridiales bacterium]|nr:hypothetical protein [Clostridiales bacterium]
MYQSRDDLSGGRASFSDGAQVQQRAAHNVLYSDKSVPEDDFAQQPDLLSGYSRSNRISGLSAESQETLSVTPEQRAIAQRTLFTGIEAPEPAPQQAGSPYAPPQYAPRQYAPPPYAPPQARPVDPYTGTFLTPGSVTYQPQSQVMPVYPPEADTRLAPSPRTMELAAPTQQGQQSLFDTTMTAPAHAVAPARPAKENTHLKFSLQRYGKLTLAIYASLVLILVALVAVTGVAVSHMSAASAATSAQIAQASAALAENKSVL